MGTLNHAYSISLFNILNVFIVICKSYENIIIVLYIYIFVNDYYKIYFYYVD